MPRRAPFAGVFLLAGCASVPAPPSGERVATPYAPPVDLVDELRRSILTEVNATRASRQLAVLVATPSLDAVAQGFAVELAGRRTLSHQSDAEGMTTLAHRLAAGGVSGWRQAGENLARVAGEAFEVAPAVVRMWLGSAAHSENMLEPRFNRSGIGVARAGASWYITQVYVQLRGGARDGEGVARDVDGAARDVDGAARAP